MPPPRPPPKKKGPPTLDPAVALSRKRGCLMGLAVGDALGTTMDGRRTIVPGFINKLVTALLRFVPRRVLLKAVDSRQTRRRSAQGS